MYNTGLDVGSRAAGRRRPTCPKVQVINGLTRHGGGYIIMEKDKQINEWDV
jgi:hypothetical protein